MKIRAFRLLSTTEIERLSPRSRAMQDSLSAHGLLKDIHLAQAKSVLEADDCLLFYAENHLLAAMDKKHLSVLQQWLLNDATQHAIYEKVSQKVLSNALKAFFQVSELRLETGTTPTDWFYKGSPCLEIHCNLGKKTFPLFIHPQWISEKALPLQEKKYHLSSLHDCLGREKIDMTVQFSGLKLSLQDLADLSEGDVIELDHPITEPLLLTIENHAVSPVKLGSKAEHKAIKLGENHV